LESAVDGKAPHTIFVMSVIINNIPSCTATGKSLGAVAFSESFLLSTIKYGEEFHYKEQVSSHQFFYIIKN